MTVYVESSAVLAWLLTEARGAEVQDVLYGSETTLASDLTLIECERTLRRVARLHPTRVADIDALDVRLAEVASTWIVEEISRAVVDRARQPFPDDAIRTLDAIHLATAVVLRAAVADVEILSLDERIRANARALGFRVLPA